MNPQFLEAIASNFEDVNTFRNFGSLYPLKTLDQRKFLYIETERSKRRLIFIDEVMVEVEHDWRNGKSELFYKNGHPHGVATTWHANGKMSSRGKYDHAVREGLWEYWHDNGVKSVERNYSQGRGNGHYISFYDNGEPEEEGNYVDGVQMGLWKGWHINGEKHYIGRYDEHGPTGLWTYWTADGQIASEGLYRSGIPVGRWKYRGDNDVIEEISY
jgi:antitoxin component YwqK of YwqJK toxin-antitoxin module